MSGFNGLPIFEVEASFANKSRQVSFDYRLINIGLEFVSEVIIIYYSSNSEQR